MENKKKYILSAAFLLALIVLSGYLIFREYPLPAVLHVLRKAKLSCVFLGLGLGLGFISGEAVNIYMVMKSLSNPLSFRACLKYAFIGFYFSGITPSSSGGQPMQLYYMKKDGVHLSYASLNFFILLGIFQLVTLTYVLGLMVIRPALIFQSIKGIELLFFYGVLLNVLCIAGLFGMAFSRRLIHRLYGFGLKLLNKLHLIKDMEQATAKLEEHLTEFRAGVAHLKTHKTIFFWVFAVSFLQMTCLYFIPYTVYRSFGLSQMSFLDILSIQAVLTISVASLPLPGAVGASEGSFLVIFKGLFTPKLLVPAMILSRSLGFYAPLLFSALVVILNHSKVISRNKLA